MRIRLRPRLLALLLLAALLWLAPSVQAAENDLNPAQDAPVAALWEAEKAAHAGDAARFEELVDINGIINAALDIFMAEAKNGSLNLPPMLALMLGGVGGQPALRGLLLNETRAFILNGINSGAFGGKVISSAQSQGILAPLFSNASIGRKDITSVGKPEREGKGWLVPFTVLDSGNGNFYDIVGYLEARDGQHRLLEIRNLRELFNKISAEASQ